MAALNDNFKKKGQTSNMALYEDMYCHFELMTV